MKMVDAHCVQCGNIRQDTLMRDSGAIAPCECGGSMERIFVPNAPTANVIQDSIEGGILIHHGICNPDGTPRRYDSKQAMREEAVRRGLVNYVEHMGDQEEGSDKSTLTTRFVGLPASLTPEDEERRRAAWWADEAQFGTDPALRDAPVDKGKGFSMAAGPHDRTKSIIKQVIHG